MKVRSLKIYLAYKTSYFFIKSLIVYGVAISNLVQK